MQGSLDDDGDTIKLLAPGTPETNGMVPHYGMDHVTYRTNTRATTNVTTLFDGGAVGTSQRFYRARWRR